MSKMPSFQFYPGDWMKDPALRSVSPAARGLWIDMLCLMFESDRRGYLQHVTGKPYTHVQLARMTGCSSDEVSLLLQELDDSGVFSSTEHGVLYSRRMVSDERKRTLCVEAGKKGGNPTLKGSYKGEYKGVIKGEPKRNQTPSSSSSSSSSIKLQNNNGVNKLTLVNASADDSHGKVDFQLFVEFWNQNIQAPKIQDLTESRKKKIQARISARKDFFDLFRNAVLEIPGNPFLRGDRGWKASFDWLIENDKNALKVVEGNYSDSSVEKEDHNQKIIKKELERHHAKNGHNDVHGVIDPPSNQQESLPAGWADKYLLR